MTKIPAESIAELKALIEATRSAIRELGEPERSKLKGVQVDDVLSKLPLDKNGALDATAWDGRSEADQDVVRATLVQVRDNLILIAHPDGPPDPNHIMYDAYAPTWAVFTLLLGAMVAMMFLLSTAHQQWTAATGSDLTTRIADAEKAQDAAIKAQADATAAERAVTKTSEAPKAPGGDAGATAEVQKQWREAQEKAEKLQAAADERAASAVKAVGELKTIRAPEAVVFGMVMLMGALGGVLHFLSSIVMFVGNRKLKRSWVPYYLAMPFTGAGLALIMYLLLRVGVLSPSGGIGAGTGIANLNLMAIYAFAMMSGLFSRSAFDKLGELFQTLFRTATPPPKDPVGDKASPVAEKPKP
jgi:hypothetical protein